MFWRVARTHNPEFSVVSPPIHSPCDIDPPKSVLAHQRERGLEKTDRKLHVCELDKSLPHRHWRDSGLSPHAYILVADLCACGRLAVLVPAPI